MFNPFFIQFCFLSRFIQIKFTIGLSILVFKHSLETSGSGRFGRPTCLDDRAGC